MKQGTAEKRAQQEFRQRLMDWHRNQNQRDLPWKGEKDPYKIWLSEIILQQTRAAQGLPYYLRFTEAYPTVRELAAAPDDEAFKLWEGLGYYSRCRNMLAAARQIVNEHGGSFPDSYDSIINLKGVGPYTAAAIASFAFGLPHAVVDGNVYRVLARYFGITTPTDSTEGKKQFQRLADEVLDRDDPGGFNQAMMDHGATICLPAAPKCNECPVAHGCVARAEGLINLLPVREKKVAVKTRYFNYLLLHFEDKLWIHRRDEKDIWRGLYEPLLIETDHQMDSKTLQENEAYKALELKGAIDYEGELQQRLTHQIIRARFFKVELTSAPPALITEGSWVSLTQLQSFAFPSVLNTLFQKKNYF